MGDSNLPLQVAFPILIDRVLTDLAAAALPPTDLVVDDPLPIEPSVGATVTAPGGATIEVPAGGAWPSRHPARVLDHHRPRPARPGRAPSTPIGPSRRWSRPRPC